jgi:methionine-S-sulfoxide reductase
VSDKDPSTYKLATFAAGRFWGVESILKGQRVIETTVGYARWNLPNPTYRDVCTGMTGHPEDVLIKYDQKGRIREVLLSIFCRAHNPTT